ncbi:MAG: FkbM family methyltransferase [Planctomycetes bacterium]|nr:FkbM family methyltransferase [Planctomycetota bacterium]
MLVPACRACLRALVTRKPRTGRVERVLRALLLLPPFGFALVLLRLRLWVLGPLTKDGVTDDGVQVRCRLPDLIQMYVYFFGVWEPDLTAFLRRRLAPGQGFVDVGANVGCMTALAARRTGAAGRVTAVEPSPPVLDELRETLRRNALTNVDLVAAAASDARGELVLYAGPQHNVGLTATVAHRGLQAVGTVPAAPLGELVPAAVLASARLVKIDVEGAEDRVLRGLLPVLDRLAPDAELIVELSPIWWQDAALRPIDVLRPFLDRGFHVYLLPNDYWPWRYLWPADVAPPRRLRDLAQLERRVPRLDIVLSRVSADEL